MYVIVQMFCHFIKVRSQIILWFGVAHWQYTSTSPRGERRGIKDAAVGISWFWLTTMVVNLSAQEAHAQWAIPLTPTNPIAMCAYGLVHVLETDEGSKNQIVCDRRQRWSPSGRLADRRACPLGTCGRWKRRRGVQVQPEYDLVDSKILLLIDELNWV